ncbi:MAG: 1-deoxy-D-xylulose-5-phosphate reductoisomerase [Candidatus Omnitrophica bacterium]|nr:1-deoxy-D-xylulose-5-phosphate reductoisomerase [Candidatus Omnitrophota bacterium]
MKRIAILGSTGSIGINCLAVIRAIPKQCRVVALSTNANSHVLSQQVREFHPAYVCVHDNAAYKHMQQQVRGTKTKLYAGNDGLCELLRDAHVDQVVVAMSGSSALLPLLVAIERKFCIALANKEALVMAGSLIMRKAKENQVTIIPIDSEQSAIWQCLDHEDKRTLRKIYLTASGGPLLFKTQRQLRDVSVREVLKHPRWAMGKKITVDSATLMNKGLEVLEAMALFDVAASTIEVVVHPEAIIHSMVEFVDGVIMAQLSATTMQIPIQFALTYPKRMPCVCQGVDFFALEQFHFQRPDNKRFPCLRLAFQAARDSGTMPSVMNAANEVSVEGFLQSKVCFNRIPGIIETVMARHRNCLRPSLKQILEADAWARKEANRVVQVFKQKER